jgi:phage portal protein BeeE
MITSGRTRTARVSPPLRMFLPVPTPIDAKKAEEYASQWAARYGPGGPGGIAVLGNGMKFEAMSMTAHDSQLIEQLGWTAETVCSVFHVPAFKIGIGTQPTYQNAETMNQVYYSDCLQSHIENMEIGLDQGLGLRQKLDSGKVYGVELDLDGLLRMDTASQVNTLTAGIGGSLYSINEARRKMDLKPKAGGDAIYSQQQNFNIEALAERDRNDPFAKAPSPPAIPAPEPQKALPAPKEEPTEEDRAASLRTRASRRARNLRIRNLAA